MTLTSKRKRGAQDSAALDEISWTATRCFRLLRSIESRIVILRRISKNCRSIVDKTTIAESRLERQDMPEKQEQPYNKHYYDMANEDPIWLSEPTPNRVAKPRTYNSRSKARVSSSQAKPKSTSEPAGPQCLSPFLRRFRRDSVNQDSSHPELNGESWIVQKEKRYFVKQTLGSDEAERQLVLAFTNILETTKDTSKEQTKRYRVSTLRSLCLGQVHAYIDLDNEAANSEDTEAESDCTFEVYTTLESWGSGGQVGWRGLREVIRAHVIGLLQKAINKKLLSEYTIEQLIKICGMKGEIRGAQSFFVSWLSTSSYPTPRQLSIFDSFSKKYDCYTWSMRSCYMINSRRPSFLSTLIRGQCSGDMIMKGLMDTPGLESSEVLYECIARAYENGTPSVATSDRTKTDVGYRLGKFVMRICLIASVGSILPDAQNDRNHLAEHMFRATSDMAFNISKNDPKLSRGFPRQLAMANILLMSLQLPQTFEHGSLDLGDLSSFLIHNCYGDCADTDIKDDDDAAVFARKFAEGILPLENYLKVDLIKRLISRLGGPEHPNKVARRLIRKVKLELAIAASRSDHSVPDDPSFMEEISKIMGLGNKNATLETPHKKPSSNRLRWEESICEWMLMTPFQLDIHEEILATADGGGAASDIELSDDASEDSVSIENPKFLNSSPDVLACSPTLEHSNQGNLSPAERLAKRGKFSRGIVTPIRPGRWRSIFETMASDSPDAIALQSEDIEHAQPMVAPKKLIFKKPNGTSFVGLHESEGKMRPNGRLPGCNSDLMADIEEEDELG